jgi:hypothetical protein
MLNCASPLPGSLAGYSSDKYQREVFGGDSVLVAKSKELPKLPALAPGSPCPTAHGHPISPSFGLGLGDGPAYPVGLESTGILQYAPPANFDSHDWGGQKVLWAVDTPHYSGVVLIRGHQLNGPNELRFERGDVPPTELRITPFPGTPDGWTGQPSYTRVRAPGCYAYQIDGLTFSQHIIFEAVATP